MHMTRDDVAALSKKRQCPRCDLDKTLGNALCRTCRSKLPPHMRNALEAIPNKDVWTVGRAMRAAANYFKIGRASCRERV